MLPTPSHLLRFHSSSTSHCLHKPGYSSHSSCGPSTLTWKSPSEQSNLPRRYMTRSWSYASPTLRLSSTTQPSWRKTSTLKRASRYTNVVSSCSLSLCPSKSGISTWRNLRSDMSVPSKPFFRVHVLIISAV